MAKFPSEKFHTMDLMISSAKLGVVGTLVMSSDLKGFVAWITAATKLQPEASKGLLERSSSVKLEKEAAAN